MKNEAPLPPAFVEIYLGENRIPSLLLYSVDFHPIPQPIYSRWGIGTIKIPTGYSPNGIFIYYSAR